MIFEKDVFEMNMGRFGCESGFNMNGFKRLCHVVCRIM